jgi:xanthine/CO dehydrogenase XdhC/CoxF family maturation factor
MLLDPIEDFHNSVAKIRSEGKAFAVATVIRVEGSASARTGSKAIFDEKGINLQGWVGGGCAERFVGEQVLESLKENKTRIVTADMDDEILGLGVACGGKMHIFIDPMPPAEIVEIPRLPAFEKEILHLTSAYGWNIHWTGDKTQVESPRELFFLLSQQVAKKRKLPCTSMRLHQFTGTEKKKNKQVTIVGRTRITEALARHFAIAGFNVRAVAPALQSEDYPSNIHCECLDGYQDVKFHPDEIVIVGSHTAQDPALVKMALTAGASYIGMIGSPKRVNEVQEHLGWSDSQMSGAPLYIPVGLNIQARNPEEIALSIVAEVIQEQWL